MTVARHPFYGVFFVLDSDFLGGMGFLETVTGATYAEMGQADKAGQHFDAGRDALQKGEKPYGILVNEALRLKVGFLSPQARPDPSRLKEYDRFLKGPRRPAPRILCGAWDMRSDEPWPGEETSRGEAVSRTRRPGLEQTRSRLREDTVKKMLQPRCRMSMRR